MGEPRLSRVHMEKLIEVVRDNPSLYDPSLPLHRDGAWTKNCWEQFATEFNTEGITGDMLRKKWKNKRDAYKKNKRTVETKRRGVGAAKISFYDKLTFLDPHITDRGTVRKVPRRQTDSPVTEVSDDDEQEAADRTNPADFRSDEEEPEVSDCDSTPSGTASKKRKTTSVGIVNPSESPLSPSPQESSTGRRRRTNQTEGGEKLDVMMMEMMEMCKQGCLTDGGIRRAEAGIEDDFFRMISGRVRMMPPRIQQWMEEQVWELYIQARRMEQAGVIGIGSSTVSEYEI